MKLLETSSRSFVVALTACCLVTASLAASPTVPQSGATRGLTEKLERRANKIGRQLKKRHLPHGTVLDPMYPGPDSNSIIGYTRAGDAAIWTGHWLAAESFRYAVTGSKQAKNNVRKAVRAIRLLVDVTGGDVLARAAVPAGSPWEGAITVGEAHQGVFRSTVGGTEYVWAGNTSRDQYSGVMFGLGFAWELVPLNLVRRDIDMIVGNLIHYLRNHAWTVQMPDGSISTTFAARPDQMLAFLQVARMVDPEGFDRPYDEVRAAFGKLVDVPIQLEATDPHGSYFKFNLDAINLVHLIRLEEAGTYRDEYVKAYGHLRDATATHGNAHFNMIDRVLNGPDATRDAETLALLADWLKRPRRNFGSDLTGLVAVCGDRACDPIPVRDRVATDFLWQRSPFELSTIGGGDIEAAGIDLLLPYWMARYYGVI